jgi:hypothetical protein
VANYNDQGGSELSTFMRKRQMMQDQPEAANPSPAQQWGAGASMQIGQNIGAMGGGAAGAPSGGTTGAAQGTAAAGSNNLDPQTQSGGKDSEIPVYGALMNFLNPQYTPDMQKMAQKPQSSFQQGQKRPRPYMYGGGA